MRKLALTVVLAACAVPVLAGCGGQADAATPAQPALPHSQVKVLTDWADVPDSAEMGWSSVRMIEVDGQCYEDVYSHSHGTETYAPHDCPTAASR